MFTILIGCSEVDDLVLASQTITALESGDSSKVLEYAALVNARLKALFPAGENGELLWLDIFNSFFTGFVRGDAGRLELFRPVFNALVDGCPLYGYDALLFVYNKVNGFRKDFVRIDLMDELNEFANELTESSVLRYLVKRESLNLLIRTGRFAERKALTEQLTEDIVDTPELIKTNAVRLGSDLYFYEERKLEQ